jgi:tRNA pseudouridine38-40 synthase
MELAYDGTQFNGFQSQLCGNTIQDHLQSALSIFFNHPVKITAASRTDSGVHAQRQVVTFYGDRTFDEWRWRRGLNSLLPESVGVLKIEAADPDFHPIRSSNGKAYRYRLWRGYCPHPLFRRYVWEVHQDLDLSLLESALSIVVGRHDFSAFCAKDAKALTRTRTIFETKVDVRGPLIDLWISGDGFLKQMVRIIVGTMVDVANLKIPLIQLPSILANRERNDAGKTAPGKGLTLVDIFYGSPKRIDQLIAESQEGFCLSL